VHKWKKAWEGYVITDHKGGCDDDIDGFSIEMIEYNLLNNVMAT